MSAARQEILDRVRGALGRRAAPSIEVPPAYRRAGTCDRVALVGLLAERISDYRATVRRTGADGVRGAVEAVCRERGVGRLGVSPAVPPEWRPGNAELVEDDGLDTQALDALDGVLTGCELAIAETGTIVLAAGPREGRRALTLVPDLHVCIVETAQIVELVPEAIARLGALVAGARRPLTFVSGPSATSDIELDRVEGVHGPRVLEVVLVEDL